MRWIACLLLVVGVSANARADVGGAPPSAQTSTPDSLTVAQVLERNAAARGGLDAWRKIASMAWTGHIERTGASSQSIAFLMELKRPNKTRFEIKAMGGAAMRVFDGAHGWKQSPSATTGMPEVQPFSAEELRFARDGYAIDGPLLDLETKGIVASLDDIDLIEGRKAYRLNLRLPSGTTQRVWIDAETFLEVRYDRTTQTPAGATGQVTVMFRDYKTFEGLQIPVVIETAAGGKMATDKMVIEKIALNPPLDDKMFAKPKVASGGHRGVVVGAGVPQAAPKPPAPIR